MASWRHTERRTITESCLYNAGNFLVSRVRIFARFQIATSKRQPGRQRDNPDEQTSKRQPCGLLTTFFRVRKNAPESFTERFAGSGMCPLEYAQVRMETNSIMETYEGWKHFAYQLIKTIKLFRKRTYGNRICPCRMPANGCQGIFSNRRVLAFLRRR